MRTGQALRLGVLLVPLAAGGCTHNYYYGNAVPVCGTPVIGPAPVTVADYGAVCAVPTQVAGGTVEAPARASAVAAATTPRLLVSEPIAPGPRAPRFAWRRPVPEQIATRVEGALDDVDVRTR